MAEPVISLQEVCKSFGSGAAQTAVLRDVTFQVEKGEFLALVGQSGSGKSTLLNIIGGLSHADSGEVTVLGTNLRKESEQGVAQLRNEKIGFVFQSFNLLDDRSCLENVLLPSLFSENDSDVDKRALAMLERVGLGEFAQRTPAELSGGQKQRVAIARALLLEPTLLLCDEPTGNLDSSTGQEVIELIQQLHREGATVVVVTHEKRMSNCASRVIAMRDGRLLQGEDALADKAGPA